MRKRKSEPKSKPKHKVKPVEPTEPKPAEHVESLAEPKREVHLPVPHECPPDVVIVPKKIDPAKVVPLAETTPPVHCVATLVCGWREDYIVLSAAPGHRLPPIKETGTEVNVQFSPPALPSAPEQEPCSEPKPPHAEPTPSTPGVAG